MSCNHGREHTLNSVQTTRDMSDMGVEFLVDSVSSSLYKSWKVQRTRPRLKLELATRMPPPRPLSFSTPDSTMFRSGLGNILYCPHHKVGNHSTADLAPEEPRLHPDEKKALNEDHQLVSQRQLTTDQLCKSR